MEIKDHFKYSNDYLDQAKKEVDAGSIEGARYCLSNCLAQTRLLLYHVQKLYLQELPDRVPKRKGLTMKIKDHFKFAKNYLDQAKKEYEARNYESSRLCLADAYSQVRALLFEV